MKTPLIESGLLLISAISLVAADAAPTNEPTELPPITVVASNGLESVKSITAPPMAHAEMLQRQDPGAMTIRGTEDLYQGRASSFLDLLHGVPGLILQSENEMEVSKISIRGSGIESEDEPLGLNVLLDGFTFNQGDGEVILEDLDVGSIQYAEVYRGASAFKYGALSLGGAINLVSTTGYDADPFRIRIDGGSYGFVRSQISSGMVDGPWDYYVSVSGRARDGFREHSYEDTELLTANVGYRFSTNAENRFFITTDRTDRLLPGGLSKEEMDADRRQTDPDVGPDGAPYAISQDYNKDWYYLRLADRVSVNNGPWQAEAGAFWWHRNIEENGPSNDESQEGIQVFNADNIGIILNVSAETEAFGRRNLLTAGFNPNIEREVDFNFVNNNGREGAPTAHDQELSINGPVFFEDQQYLTEKLSLVGGAQLNYAQRHFRDYFFEPGSSANLVFRGVSPKAGAIYEPTEHSQVFANISKSWQPPSFDNMVDFDNAPIVEFQPLSAQHAWTVELGSRGKEGPVSWDFALYHSWLRSELLELSDASGVDIGAVNINKSYHQGIEAGLDVDLLDLFNPRADRPQDEISLDQEFTLSDLRFDHDPTYGNNRIAGIPVYVYQAHLKYTSPFGFYAGPSLDWSIVKYPADNMNTLFADPYALLGFRMGWESESKKLSAYFEMKNLTDKTYASSVDPIASAQFAANGPYTVFHPGDGRSFYGGVTYRW